MLMIISQTVCGLFVAVFFIISLWMEKWSFKNVMKTKVIALMGLLCALSVVLTNLIGYSNIFGMKIMLGNFILFLSGMIIGPLAGIFLVFSSDILGTIVNSGGIYHTAFLLVKVIMSMSGSLVFLFKKDLFWIIWAAFLLFFSLSIQLFVLNPIGVWAIYGTSFAKINFIQKLILLPIEFVLYLSLIISSFKVLWIIINKNDNFWVHRLIKEKDKQTLEWNSILRTKRSYEENNMKE